MRDSVIYPRFLYAGETALIVEFGDSVNAGLNQQVHVLDACVNANPPPGFIEAVPTYRSLLLRYDPLLTTHKTLAQSLQQMMKSCTADSLANRQRTFTLEVHYGGEYGPDLASVAAHSGLREQHVIERHISGDYTVAMLGFAPGFCYLLGLPPNLATPRLATPRLHVPPGSVGIAGPQTGVYALDTPGGWQIIGRTEHVLFDPAREEPFTLRPGDHVKFVAVGDERR